MSRPYNWARLAVNAGQGGPQDTPPANDTVSPQFLEMMRAMAAHVNGANTPMLPRSSGALYTDTPGALQSQAPIPTTACDTVCHLRNRETANPDVLAQLQRQNSPDYVAQSVFLANTITPQSDVDGVLYFPMPKLSRGVPQAIHGKKAGMVRVTIPVAEEKFQFLLVVDYPLSAAFVRRTYNVGVVQFSSLGCRISVLILVVAFPLLAPALQNDPVSLQIGVESPQTIVAGESFNFPLVAHGGAAPYTWSRTDGDLPPGLRLLHHKGVIDGVPTTPGEYRFNLSVTDSNVPHQQVQREITIKVIAALTIDWKQPPAVQGNTLSGSAVVTNQTGHSLDVTVIIVAVNAIGRATSLGYQRFILPAQSASPVIPFGTSPGPGAYTVRVDAVAHRKSGHPIFRVSKQTSGTLAITQL
jgi:Putative Ig domain